MAKKPVCVTMSDDLINTINEVSDAIHFSRSWVTEFLIKQGIKAGGLSDLARFGILDAKEVSDNVRV